MKSWYARLLAVRRVTQDNRGKHTAGIDGVKSLPPSKRLALARDLRLDGKGTALRRTWIPKRGTASEKRPLGIPTQRERARQTMVRQVLEPEWEAKLSPHTYGFRPGRSCWDAIEAIFHRIKFRPQYALKIGLYNSARQSRPDIVFQPATVRLTDNPAYVSRYTCFQYAVNDANASCQ
jgi:RNA-directed DNA polymerase